MLTRKILFKTKLLNTMLLSHFVLLTACSNLAQNTSPSIDKISAQTKIATEFSSTKTNSNLAVNTEQKTQLPERKPNKNYQALIKDGLGQFSNPALTTVIAQALLDNYKIKEQQSVLAQAIQQQIIAQADQGFNLSLASTNSARGIDQSSTVTKNYDLALQASFNPDLWGGLSSQTKAAHLQVAQARANLERAKQQLIADITSAWYQLIYNQKLYALTFAQQKNTQEQLVAIESAYNQGLIQSLDVYLARTNLDNAHSNTTTSQQALSAASRKLELLFAAYPSGKLVLDGELATLTDNFSLGIPTDLLQNRFDLNSSWLALLTQNAGVAHRYAAQFPQFNLTGNLSLTSIRLADLFKQNLAWSLLASVNQSIFDNGKNKALYKQAQAKLIEREQQYLQALQSAFSEVENLLDEQKSFNKQWLLNQQALENTELSYERVKVQYRNGIANYQQVLSIQQQLFEKQKSQLGFKMKLIDNRINLLLALGKKEPQKTKTESK